MRSNRGSRRLERRPERQARRPGGAPRPSRQRASRTPVRVKSRSTINLVPVLGLLGAAALAAVVIYAVIQSTTTSGDQTAGHVAAENDASESLPGKYYAPHPGFDGIPNTGDERQHVTQIIPICTAEQLASKQIGGCYHSNPPTSGPHSPSPAAFKVYENPVPKESLLHSMEHGGVIVLYNTEDREVIRQLEAVVREQLDRRRFVVMTQYTDMEPETIALTAWTRLDKFPAAEFNRERVRKFIEVHNKRFNPEGF